jgi:uncharacterized protein with HEPN domain
MTTQNPSIRLGHIREEITRITSELAGIDQEAYSRSYLLMRAGERALLIISEAAKSLQRIA